MHGHSWVFDQPAGASWRGKENTIGYARIYPDSHVFAHLIPFLNRLLQQTHLFDPHCVLHLFRIFTLLSSYFYPAPSS
jgi:hypothetical protein